MNKGTNSPKILTIALIALTIASFTLWHFYLHQNEPVQDTDANRGFPFASFSSDSTSNSMLLKYLNIPSDTTVTVTLSSTIPKLSMRVRISSDSARAKKAVLYDIDFLQQSDSRLIQCIRDTSETDMATGVGLLDINFDGLLDLEIISDIDAVGNPSCHFWTYDNTLHRFILSAEFSERLSGGFTLNPEKKQISTGFRVGMGAGSETYQVVEGHLLLIERSTEEEVVINDTMKTKTTLEKLIDGKMKVVQETYDIR